MSNLVKLLTAFLVGIALSACRTTPPEPEEPPVPPQPPTDEDTDTEDEQEEPDVPEPPVDEEEEPEPPVEDDVDPEEELNQELETIDALEIDPYWGPMLETDLESVLERLIVTCVILDEESVTNIVLDMMNEDVPQLSAEHMVETAVFIVCPEYIPDYEAYLLNQRS